MAGKRCIIKRPLGWKGWLGLGAACAALIAAALALLLPLFWGKQTPDLPERLVNASQGLSHYDVTLRLLPEDGEIAITETIAYRNDTGDTLDHLLLRAWLNAYQTEETSPAALEELYDACYYSGFSPGNVTLFDVTWNAAPAAHAYLDSAQTALRVEIPPLAPGEEGALYLRCVARIPLCAHRTGRVGEDWQLGNVIPLLSHYENGAWRADPYCPIGDPFLSDCANFYVALHGAADYAVAASALMERDDQGVWRGEALAARDFALCLLKNGKTAEGWAGKVLVRSLSQTEAGARRALENAKRAVSVYAELYGAYPYPALTLCQADFPFGGMEYPALCMIGGGNYLESRADSLELEIAHEAAHQWFYALVGSDQVKDPWQDEALCEYAMLRYVRARYGPDSFAALRAIRVDAAMRERHLDALTPGSPIDYYGDLSAYAAVAYRRGAALILALDELLPGGADGFLRAYAEEYAFRFVSRAEFEEFLCRYAGMDLRPLLLDYLDTAL